MLTAFFINDIISSSHCLLKEIITVISMLSTTLPQDFFLLFLFKSVCYRVVKRKGFMACRTCGLDVL